MKKKKNKGEVTLAIVFFIALQAIIIGAIFHDIAEPDFKTPQERWAAECPDLEALSLELIDVCLEID